MKGKKKKKPAFIPLIIAIFILLIAIAAGIFSLYKQPPETPGPIYEEDYSSSNNLRAKIARVDHLVYEILYREGVKEEEISFSKVIPKHEKKMTWDFTELTVRLNNPDLVKRIEGVISKRISGISPDVLFESQKISNDQVAFEVWISGCFTHRLVFKYKTENKTGARQLPKVAFIIDDIGYDAALARSFMDLKIPVCLSVLPYAPYSAKIASETVNSGVELLLHLPMEPKGYPGIDPGKGALMVSMDRETIRGMVNEQIMKFPGLKGVNHHMGSLFSENYIKMKHVIEEVKRHNLYYVDSRTTDRSVACKVAKELKVPVAEKKWFIDNDLSEKALKYQMDRLLGVARYSGSAIGIGHPHPETLNILKKYTEQLKKDYEV
ncbi:MAG: divergent polysaccharide deacetylase family protein, partial [Deltaproteobacteria bacterium]|nr:divergent polysaccharide deacetylase family protein [Deltaproteobacteria bacterium]